MAVNKECARSPTAYVMWMCNWKLQFNLQGCNEIMFRLNSQLLQLNFFALLFKFCKYAYLQLTVTIRTVSTAGASHSFPTLFPSPTLANK